MCIYQICHGLASTDRRRKRREHRRSDQQGGNKITRSFIQCLPTLSVCGLKQVKRKTHFLYRPVTKDGCVTKILTYPRNLHVNPRPNWYRIQLERHQRICKMFSIPTHAIRDIYAPLVLFTKQVDHERTMHLEFPNMPHYNRNKLRFNV